MTKNKMAKEDLKNEMANLVERWFQLNNCEISYEELVELEKERVETKMWDLIYKDWELNQELEDMLPHPICYR